jgi:hypothetical protein
MEKGNEKKTNSQKAIKELKEAIKDYIRKDKPIKFNTMKKFLLISGLMIIISVSLFAQDSNKETSTVLLKCIELTELQQFYPAEADGSLKPICIMQYPVSFPSGIELEYKGKKVLFLTRPMVYEKNIKAFFLIHKIDITESKATVEFEFDYYSNNNLNVISTTAFLIKRENIWIISEKNNVLDN